MSQPTASITRGCVTCTGRNHNGQLGVGGTADVQEPQVMQVRWPATPSHCTFSSKNTSSGLPHRTCGRPPSQAKARSLGATVQVVRRWAALSIGESHAAGVSGDNQTYTWGCNEHGQLGVAAGEPSDVPRKMNILRGWDVRAIACG